MNTNEPEVKIEKQASAQPVQQIPGCLPVGYDLDSLLTVAQFAVWRQIAVKTARAKLPGMAGVIKYSREDIRIHPRTYLELSFKKRRL